MTSKRYNNTTGAPLAPPTAIVRDAAMWLADQSTPPAPLIPALRDRFKLSAIEACQASELASRFRTMRRAFA
jgi:hypothetical protein